MQFASLAMGLAALALPASAIAQDTHCIAQSESRAVVANLLPDMIRATASACRTDLPRGAYLPANADRLATSLTPLAEASWSQARGTYETIIGSELPDSPELIAFGRMALADGIARELDAQACDTVDRLVAQIAPLPPENFANVFALFLELGANNSADSPLRICAAKP
ncbi:MAG: hypothetical protein WA918_13540 [Erythrobacter sp.]